MIHRFGNVLEMEGNHHCIGTFTLKIDIDKNECRSIIIFLYLEITFH